MSLFQKVRVQFLAPRRYTTIIVTPVEGIWHPLQAAVIYKNAAGKTHMHEINTSLIKKNERVLECSTPVRLRSRQLSQSRRKALGAPSSGRARGLFPGLCRVCSAALPMLPAALGQGKARSHAACCAAELRAQVLWTAYTFYLQYFHSRMHLPSGNPVMSQEALTFPTVRAWSPSLSPL